MYKMMALVALFVSSFASAQADVNLKAHETRIKAYHDKMVNEGKVPSQEMVAVLQGMKKGKYTYDFETARKVMQDARPNHTPATPKMLK